MRDIRFRRPEFQEKLKKARHFERRLGPAGWRKIVKWGAVILAAAVVYFFTLSQFFLVTSAEVLSPNFSPEQIRDVLKIIGNQRRFLIPENHILLLSKTNMLKNLQKELPQIRAVTDYRRVFPNKIRIGLVERLPSYVWQSGENHYLLDQEGVAFQKVLNYSPSAFSEILVVDKTGKEVNVGEELVPANILEFMEKTKALWPQQVRETNFVSFSLPGTKSADIFVKTAIGFEVYFDLNRGVEVQLSNLALILGREIKPETYPGLSYVDLRLANTGYYCYLDAPCAAGKN